MDKRTRAVFGNRFRTRAFASLGLLLSFLATAFSGAVLYFRPEGSLADWARWEVFGIDKKGWEGIHVLCVILLLGFAAVHLILNRKALFGYLKMRSVENARPGLEFGLAFALFAFLLAGAVTRWPPLWKIMDLRSDIKQGRYSVDDPPPFSGAAELSLDDLCVRIDVPLEEAVSNLEKADIPIENPKTTLAELAVKHEISPERLLRIIQSQARSDTPFGAAEKNSR